MAAALALLLLVVSSAAQGSDVVVQHADGSGRVSLTGGVGRAGQPVWSPDGTKVAFVSNLDSAGQSPAHVFVANADGTGLHVLAPALPALSPAWSPDGTEIAFLSGPSFGVSDVWVVPEAGGPPRRLTSDGGDKGGLAWSPAGATILYRIAKVGDVALVALDAVTAGTRRLATVVYPFVGPAASWSPDGSRIAFLDVNGRVSVMNADGSAARELDDQLFRSLPRWSPDGTSIVFTALRYLPGPPTRYGPPQAADAWTVDVASGVKRRLTGAFDPDVVAAPATAADWWPDASRVLFQRNDGGASNIWQMNADGTCERPFAVSEQSQPVPQWQPAHALPVGPLRCADLRVRILTYAAETIGLRAFAQVSVVVENDGNLAATDVRAVFASPQHASLRLGACNAASCSLGTIPAGGTRRFDATFGGLTAPVFLQTSITATANEPDATPEDAVGRAVVQVANCTIAGTSHADVLTGGRGRDRICGFPGADRIDGGNGDDFLDAGNGNDTVIGGDGRDTIMGRGGRDVIYARDGRLDWIDCGTEYDIAVVDKVDHTHRCDKVVRR